MTVRPAAAGTVDAATGTRFVSGGVIRLLRSYPGPWEAHAMAANGSSQLLENSATEPGYKASFLILLSCFKLPVHEARARALFEGRCLGGSAT